MTTTFGERVNDEIDAWNAAMDRKEAELDKFGYGGDPSKPAPKVVGLDAFARPAREDYVRVTVTAKGFTVEPGVEYRDGDVFSDVVGELREIAEEMARDGLNEARDQMRVAREVGGDIARTWPDRAYFVEVWQEGREGFAQVFQPWGVPRNRSEP